MATDPVYRLHYEESLAAIELVVDDTSGAALMPRGGTALSLDSPDFLRAQLVGRFEAGLRAMRDARGTVHDAADIAPTVRTVDDVRTWATDNAKVFTGIAKRAGAVLEEELIEAVGANDRGVPRGEVRIVKEDGTTVRLGLDFESVRVWDTAPLVRGVAILADTEWQKKNVNPADDPIGFAMHVATRVVNGLLNKPTVSVRGWEDLIRELGAHQLDGVAETVKGAEVSKTSKYKGVKPETIQPKKTS